MKSVRDLIRSKRAAAKAAGVRLPKRPPDPAGAPALETWRDRATAALDAGDLKEMLRICARHIRTGEHADAIGRGYEAAQRPDFQRSLGRDPDTLFADGVMAARAVIGR